ncbi:hypothetical protein SDJN02_01248 [Cucurbita argyrosperma subsp. argyrosperma]|nr:hypothetical protein SDJN02_01248 [Cucurbita argyrosperma subsp. argyrosperma]
MFTDGLDKVAFDGIREKEVPLSDPSLAIERVPEQGGLGLPPPSKFRSDICRDAIPLSRADVGGGHRQWPKGLRAAKWKVSDDDVKMTFPWQPPFCASSNELNKCPENAKT